MDRYDTNSKGTSPALSALLNKFADMPRSPFDETRTKTLDAAPFAIIPIECFLMFPNSEGYLRYDVRAMSKNPTIKRMLSSMNVELRTYQCRCSDLWEGWNNFITKGRSGKLNMKIPYVDFVHNSKSSALPYNPCHYLNIAPAVNWAVTHSFKKNSGIQDLTETYGDNSDPLFDTTGLLGSSFALGTSKAYSEGISALPFVMYAKIAKEYQNSNLLQENPYWYPENENHDLILPYNATHAANASYDSPTVAFGDTETIGGISVTHNEIQPTNDLKSLPWLNVLYYRQRKGNYFNTGSPFPDLIRGDVPTLDVLSGSINWDNVIFNNDTAISEFGLLGLVNIGSSNWRLGSIENNTGVLGGSNQAVSIKNTNSLNGNTNLDVEKNITNVRLKNALSNATIQGINFSLNQWRRLAALTIFRERMARTDGSYNQMIQAQFQHNPKWHEHSVTYCGGSYQPIVFSEVVQQSADASSPLGTTAGRAITSDSGQEIQVRTDDYSIFMTVMTITPDDYYCQGIDRMWSELTQAEQYFPILNNLEPQAIKNKELFLTGTDSDDEDVFNYQELFSHFKSRQNQVSGLMALPIEKVGDTGAYIFNRIFTAKPQFNNKFVTGEFTDNENLCFASTEQAQFVFDIASSFKYVAPMPAVTQPSDMGLSY